MIIQFALKYDASERKGDRKTQKYSLVAFTP